MLNGYKQLVTKVTRIAEVSKTLIDTIFTNKNNPKTYQKPTPYRPVYLIMIWWDVSVHCRNYKDYDPKALQKDLQQQSWVTYYSFKEPNSATWIYLKLILTHLFDKHAPQIEKKVKGRYCPWLTPGIKRLMNERDIQLRKARRTNKESDWSDYKRRKNVCNNAIRLAKNCYHKELINENVNNPRHFWENIKKVIPNNGSKITSSAPFIKDYSASDNDESQQKSKAGIFCTFFSSVANNLKGKAIKLCNFTWKKLKSNPIQTTSKFNFRLVNKIWVENQLRLLKRSKATGPDNLPPGMLKDCSNELSGPLCYLINLTMINGTIPNEWKLAKVIPIFKYGDRTDPNNYRPISILPISILERAVHSQLLDHLEKIPSPNKLSVWLS